MTRATLLLLLTACDPKPTPWVITSSTLVFTVEATTIEENNHDSLHWQGRLTRLALGGPDAVRIDVELRDADGIAMGGGSVIAGAALDGVHDHEVVTVPTNLGTGAEVCAWVQADETNMWRSDGRMVADIGNCWGMP